MLEKIFHLRSQNTSVKTEILAGITTFLTMAYIVFIQPAILSVDFSGRPTGLDFGGVLLATCLISAATTIFMGIYANYPICLAPGMGENFFFISVIMALSGMGIVNAWQVALGIVFISGVLFLILSVLPVREAIINSISLSMRNGIAVGIGLFITFIGFQHGGLIISKPSTMVGLPANLLSHDIAVFAFGLIVTSVLRARGTNGYILWGIIASAVLAILLGEVNYVGLIGWPEIHQTIALKLDIKTALNLSCWPFIFVFLFMDVFDTIGTLMGVAETGNLIKDNKLPRANRVLLVDSTGTMAGALFGTSTVTSYIESVTGIAAGGRTGLTSIVVGFLFLISLIFGPFISMVARYLPITAPALILVGTMMLQNVRKIEWDDPSEYIPAFLTMVGIPFCYSIADGLAIGFISYPIIKFLSGKRKDISWVMYIMMFILLWYFIFIRSRLS